MKLDVNGYANYQADKKNITGIHRDFFIMGIEHVCNEIDKGNLIPDAQSLLSEKDKELADARSEIVRLSWLAAYHSPEHWVKEKGYEYDDYAGDDSKGGWIKRGVPFQRTLQWSDLRDMFIKENNLTMSLPSPPTK